MTHNAEHFARLANIAARKADAAQWSEKNGREMLIQWEPEDLPYLGMISIEECGDENMLFRTSDGVRGFVKVF